MDAIAVNSESAEQLLQRTLFLVEATSFEQHALWERFSRENTGHGYAWEQLPSGWCVTCGEINYRPVCISLAWNRIGGQLVCFWHATSILADYEMINEWFDRNFHGRWDGGTRKSMSDASNFHLCLNAIAEAPTPGGGDAAK